AVYALVNRSPGTVLLEGGWGQSNPNEEPWTRLFTAPLRVCAAYRRDEIPGLFAEIEQAVGSGCCAAGFFSYECGQCFEPTAGMRPPRAGAPLAWFGIYDRAFRLDAASGEFVDGTPAGFEAGAESCQQDAGPDGPLAAEFSLSEAEYARRIDVIHEWIRAGDVYQLNLTAPLRAGSIGDGAALYARLRSRQPAQYGTFLHGPEGRHILSFSPELFFRIEEDAGARRITARPMKGTAARGRTTDEDRKAAEWLRKDAKNRSENLMIVDLLRSDLGRVARTGTVRAEKLFTTEKLPTLWQMTSTVTAELRADADYEAVFRALFPCGSITGAPKVRAMQLIGQIEDEPRGVYTGAIGFFSPRLTVFNVAIRTLEIEGGSGAMGVGSGVVIDSDAGSEYRECLLKGAFLTGGAAGSARLPEEDFSLIETLRWEGGFPLLPLHLDRLADSAEYFDFTCDRAAVQAALEEFACGFTDRAPRRMRLLLGRDGELEIADEILSPPASDSVLRVRIAPERADPADPMLFHKTTHRPLYAAAFAAASRAGFADVLFFNLRGELTEGAISNVFVEKDGRWSTPPVDCGLLAGVYRRHLLATRPEIEERVLREDDLRCADAVYIANAVRGLRRVEVDWERHG
ncbi:MAG: aminodeoxychorismate synthase component I, partial [Acidobacteriota bacterium]